MLLNLPSASVTRNIIDIYDKKEEDKTFLLTSQRTSSVLKLYETFWYGINELASAGDVKSK